MIARRRMAFDKLYGMWLPVIAYDIGRPEDTTIPIEQHPAVLEDAAIGPTEQLEGEPPSRYDGPRTWTQGEKVELIRRYLAQNGPQQATDIAAAISDKVTSTSTTLKRHAGIFKIVEYRKYAHGKVAVWGLRPEEWKQ